jgi:fibronectin type 3 domain-containing protein
MGYVVQKAVGDGIEFIQISGTLKDLKYIDFSALENRKSIYRVLAIDAIGNLSDPVTIDYVLPKYTGVSGGVTIKKPNDMKVKLNPGILK